MERRPSSDGNRRKQNMTGIALGVVLGMAAPSQTELTIYNGGFALVKQQRDLTLQEGIQTIGIEDVAQTIEANSVAIRSVTKPGSFSVLEQSYQYDLISTSAILNKAVGQRIVFNRILPNGVKERLEGTLVSAPTAVVSDANGNLGSTWNGMVIQTDDGRILLNPNGEIEVSSLPSGLISRPTLVWMLQSAMAGVNTVELSYLAQAISWKSDYVLALDEAGKIGDLKGWVTVTNNTGTTFPGAKLKLLAGEVNRVQPTYPPGFARGGPERAAMAAAKDSFSEEQFGDYHLYTLGRPSDIRNKEIKQLSLLEAVGVPVGKKLIVDPMRYYAGFRPSEGEVGTGPIKPTIRLEFKNDKASKLGMPLPAGTFKVFQRDSSGSLQLLGESTINHTPREEKITLDVGRAFDVVVERKRSEFSWIGSNNNRSGMRETFVIELRNRKETADTVTLIERHWGQHKILKTNLEPVKLDSETYEFTVPLKANEVRQVIYSVETRW